METYDKELRGNFAIMKVYGRIKTGIMKNQAKMKLI